LSAELEKIKKLYAIALDGLQASKDTGNRVAELCMEELKKKEEEQETSDNS